MTREEFKRAMGLAYWRSNDADLPCFAHRLSVTGAINTPALIKECIKHACDESHNDVIVFSVTERDACWKVWSNYAKAHPRTFKVVEGGSLHGRYMCRMYIYSKPIAKRKFGNQKGK